MEKSMFLALSLCSWMIVTVAEHYGENVTASHDCQNIDGETWITITVNDTQNLYEKIIATQDNVYLKHTNCLFVRDRGDGNYKLSVGIARDENDEPYQVYPIIDTVPGIENDDADCFIDYVTKEGFATLRFLALANENLLQREKDLKVTAACNLSLSVQDISGIPADIESITNLQNMSTITAVAPGISCYMANENAPLIPLSSPFTIGGHFYITCTVTTADDASRVGFQMTNVEIGTNEKMEGITIPISDDNGCILYDNKLAASFITSDTENNALIQVNDVEFNYTTMEAPSNDLVVTTTSMIGPFIVNGIIRKNGAFSPKMFIGFSYEFSCLDMTDLRCIDQAEHCKRTGNYNGNGITGPRRKRRSDVTSGHLMLEVDILPPTAQLSNTEQVSAQDSKPAQVARECVAPTFYWMLAAILGVLLLLMIVVCVFLALRLRRERSYKETIFEREAHKNPAYN